MRLNVLPHPGQVQHRGQRNLRVASRVPRTATDSGRTALLQQPFTKPSQSTRAACRSCTRPCTCSSARRRPKAHGAVLLQRRIAAPPGRSASSAHRRVGPSMASKSATFSTLSSSASYRAERLVLKGAWQHVLLGSWKLTLLKLLMRWSVFTSVLKFLSRVLWVLTAQCPSGSEGSSAAAPPAAL